MSLFTFNPSDISHFGTYLAMNATSCATPFVDLFRKLAKRWPLRLRQSSYPVKKSERDENVSGSNRGPRVCEANALTARP